MMNWRDDIPKFHLSHAKILYMVYFFFKKGDINFQQKHKLKEYVILENEKIFKLYQIFEEDGFNMNFLLEGMRNIYNEEIKYALQDMESPVNIRDEEEPQRPVKGESNRAVNSNNGKGCSEDSSIQHISLFPTKPCEVAENNIEDLNSPMGLALMGKKKKAQHNDEGKKIKGEGKHLETAEKKNSKEKYKETFLGRAVIKIKNSNGNNN